MPEAFNSCIPVVSAKLVQYLQSFTFVADTMDDLKTGLQPFIIADGSTDHCQANPEVARLHGLLSSGEQAVMLSDLEALKAKEVTSIPLNYFELECNLGMFGTLLGTVLGNNHVLTVAYRAFWNLFSQGFCNELQQIVDTKGYIKPAHLLRSLQLVYYLWLTQRHNRLTPPNPDFAQIVYTVTFNTYHLPLQLYKLAYPKQPVLLRDTPSLASSSGFSSGLSGGASTTSGISIPTAFITAAVPLVPALVLVKEYVVNASGSPTSLPTPIYRILLTLM